MTAGKRGNPGPKEIYSRGVPSAESLWLDGVDKRANDWDYDMSAGLKLDNILQLVFPLKYQPVYHEMASRFMRLLLSRGDVTGKDIKIMLESSSSSAATFYNRVLPRLKCVGMVKTVRIDASKNPGQGRLAYTYDSSFSDFFELVSNDYKRIIRLAGSGRPEDIRGI